MDLFLRKKKDRSKRETVQLLLSQLQQEPPPPSKPRKTKKPIVKKKRPAIEAEPKSRPHKTHDTTSTSYEPLEEPLYNMESDLRSQIIALGEQVSELQDRLWAQGNTLHNVCERLNETRREVQAMPRPAPQQDQDVEMRCHDAMQLDRCTIL
jgi:hypothetical protein